MLVDAAAARKQLERAQALLTAIERRDGVAVRAALATGALPGMSVQGRLPLLEAVSTGVLDLVRALLDAGAFPDATIERHGQPGPSALTQAVQARHEDIALALVDAGAALDGRVLDWSLVDAASALSLPRLAAALRERGLVPRADDSLSFCDAAALGRTERVAALLPSASRVDRGKALTLAAQGGHREVVDALLAARPEVAHLQAALFPAIQNDQLVIVERLLSHGASATAPTGITRSLPLLVAAEHGHSSIVSCLLEAGADPTADVEGTTLLERAHPSVRALLEGAPRRG